MAIGLLQERIQVALAPQTAATNATASSSIIDLATGQAVRINFVGAFVSASNASNAIASFELQSNTASTGGTWVTIPGAQGVTTTTAAATQFVLPTSTLTTSAYNIEVSLIGNQPNIGRFVRAVYQPVTNNNTNAVIATFGRLVEEPNTAAEAGAWARVTL